MSTSVRVFRWLIAVALSLSVIACAPIHRRDGVIKVLILSGKNNHEWEKTTPVLERMFSSSGLFLVSITNDPDTLRFRDLSRFDVLVSNRNNWPDTSTLPGSKWQKDFIKYIESGGGAVFIHAGASSFYGWKEYHKVGIGRWGKNTRHGEQTTGRVTGFSRENPVTAGLKDFYIFDELWEDTDIYPGAEPLASISATDKKDGHSISCNAVFVNHAGKGRSFYTTLGHNNRAMFNSGFQTLILRAAQWTAGREVTIKAPDEITEQGRVNSGFQWSKSDTTLALVKDSSLIWQFNYNNRFGKPYFHPVSVNRSVLTCKSPMDHPWHLGLWFCWKYINGVNYWEYTPDHMSEKTGFKSEGITQIISQSVTYNPDHSADISLEIKYHPADSTSVLSETRKMHVSPPVTDGSFFIDEDHLFTALTEKCVLDRTPILAEPDGKSWGGYAGLSVRFNQDLTNPDVMAPDSTGNYKKNKWVYMGFTTLSGGTAGTCIFTDPALTTRQTSWYIIRTTDIPFFYYSPSVIFDGKIILKKGEKLHLRYRTWILGGKPAQEDLQKKYDDFVKYYNK